MNTLFQDELRLINVGLRGVGEAAQQAGAAVLQVDWSPPALGDREAGRQLARLIKHAAVEAANRTAFERYLAAQPVLEGVGIAGRVMPDFGERMILHAGPPIEWERMCGPMQGAIIGAVLFERWAATAVEKMFRFF